MQTLLNPYIAGAPIVEPSMFFGRQDVFQWIERNLSGKYVDHILVIHGQRRVGKTSVLKQIPNFLPKTYIQVFFDLQGRTATTLDRFLWWLGREIARVLRQSHGLAVPAPEQAAFIEDPDYLYAQFLPSLKPLLGEHKLLLTFDEFDTLEQPEIRETLGRPLIDYLRRLFEVEGLNFIFSIGSSGRKLENMQAYYTDFFKTALYRKISFLSKDDCQQLIARPVEGVLAYDPQAIERIYAVTGGHPYFAQLVCHELFSLCQKTGMRSLSEGDVDGILDDVIERGTVNLKFTWDEASHLEKWILACLAQAEGAASMAELSRTLQGQRVRALEPDLNAALLHLREKDVLSEENRFVVYLLRRWLQKNRPLDRVREELVEVNPIANRYIEIGEEYRGRGRVKEAVESFQQALVADPQNLKAQTNIAGIYLEQRDYPAAAQAYEKALAIDDEDVSARTGVCDAYIALGEAALERQEAEQAKGYYRRVLEVNWEHNEARQRLSKILCKQAEEDLAQGRDEEALKTFNAALEYTPDDEALQARYDEVCEQVKGKVLADLLVKAEAEQERGNWEKAIVHLEDYLRFEHGDAEVVAQLAEARRQQHLSQLARLKAQGKEMARVERWKEAVEAWQAYLKLEPEDRKDAEAALSLVQRNQQLDESYLNGQEAIRAKDYPLAIRLFQGIIAMEPAYKDAARLLAEAIVAERKRRPLRLGRWAWVGLVIVIIAALAGVFGRDGLTYLANRNEKPTATAAEVAAAVPTQSPTPNVQATNTPAITKTPTRAATISPTQPAANPTAPSTATADPQWEINFAQPILDYIASSKPDFEDDFSEVKPEWRLTSWTEDNGEKALNYADYITEYALKLWIEPKTTLALKADRLSNPDFALQFDIFLYPGSFTVDQGVRFRATDQGAYLLWVYSQNVNWQILKQTSETTERLVRDYSGELHSGGYTRVLLIAKGDQIAVYFNDKPAGYVQDSTFTNGEVHLEFIGGLDEVRTIVDNLKYWELKGEDEPAWVADFAQPILDTIRERKPSFEEDFTAPDALWHFGHWGDLYAGETSKWRLLSDYVQDGEMRVEFDPNTFYFLYRDLGANSSYAVQFDVTLDASDANTKFYFSPGKQAVTMNILPHEGWWSIGDSRDSLIYGNGYSQEIGNNKLMKVLLIAKSYEFAVFLNDVPLTYFKSKEKDDFQVVEFEFKTGRGRLKVKMDNLKYWILRSS
jgi:tetratricopeptide (TPR) repeat protein